VTIAGRAVTVTIGPVSRPCRRGAAGGAAGGRARAALRLVVAAPADSDILPVSRHGTLSSPTAAQGLSGPGARAGTPTVIPTVTVARAEP
jgi:hypothetical protein